MIRSTKHTLKFTNKKKRTILDSFRKQYIQMVEKYINIIWNEMKNNCPSMLDNYICKLIKTEAENDSRIRQCAAKQACSIVKGVVDKQNKRLFVLKKLQKEGKNTKYLQRKIDITKISKPKCKNINLELDSRFIDLKQNGKYFDIFIQISEIGDKRKVKIPINHTKQSRLWQNQGELRPSIRLSKNSITLYFEVKKKKIKGEKVKRQSGQTKVN